MVLGFSRTTSTGSLAGTGNSLNRTPSSGSLTNALKRLNSRGTSFLSGNTPNLAGAKHATTESDIIEEEVGDWNYLIIDPKGIRSHSDASYSKESKSENKFSQGVIIEVHRRRKSGWTTFLCLKGSEKEWLFDVSPKDRKVRMVEVEVTVGDWKYESCVFERIPVLPFPLVAQKNAIQVASQNGRGFLEINESVSVTKRVRPVSGKGSFLKLADARGWVLDFADGRRFMQRWIDPSGHDDISEPSTSSSELSVVYTLCENSLGPPEAGKWEYVVLDPRGMTLRSTPSYDPNQKTNRRIHEGEVVVINERRVCDGMTFLHCECPQGWVFDRQPGKDSRVRMMEAKVETGVWNYVVTAETGIALRTRCSFSENTKCGKGPLRGSLIEVSQQVRVGETTFLQLKDGGQWLFDSKNGRKLLDGPVELQEFSSPVFATVKAPDGVHLRQSPTCQKWAITKMLLLQNAQVEVKRMFGVEYTTFAFVSKAGSGMAGWVRMSDLCLDGSSPASSGLRSFASASRPQAFSKQQPYKAFLETSSSVATGVPSVVSSSVPQACTEQQQALQFWPSKLANEDGSPASSDLRNVASSACPQVFTQEDSQASNELLYKEMH